MDGGAKNPNWIRAIDVETLERQGRAILRHEGRQIALFATPEGVRACNNRCPHEGYPLSEGTLGKGAESGCVLTCNWHNWKFDLATGANLDRGEALRVYPVKLEEGAVWLDLTDPPVEARRARVLASLRSAFDDEDYERMARELARLSALGDPLDALRAGDLLVMGTAGIWLDPRLCRHGLLEVACARSGRKTARPGSPPCSKAWRRWRRIACGRRPHPFTEGERPWREADFLAAIEAEDEDSAVACLRGAFAAGLHFADLERAFARAALAHYADFGHSLIYAVKAGELIQGLGPSVEMPLALALARSLVYATREDLIPEFRDYAAALASWGGEGQGAGGSGLPWPQRTPRAGADRCPWAGRTPRSLWRLARHQCS